jgi:hypothetical protein
MIGQQLGKGTAIMKKLRHILVLFLIISITLGLMIFHSPDVAALTGAITLSTLSGNTGSTVNVTGSGFTPGQTVAIYLNSSIVNTDTIDAAGNFIKSITIPELPRGTYQVRAATPSDSSNNESFTVIPYITIDSAIGRSGSQVKISGSGFRASSTMSFLFDGTNVTTALSNASGTFANVLVTVPSATIGQHIFSVKDINGSSNDISFTTIEPLLTLSPNSGHVGDSILVSGSGFKANTAVTILFDTSTAGTVTADGNGSFTAIKVVVPGSQAGTHKLSGRDSLGSSREIDFITLAPEISLSLNEGRVGDQIFVNGRGFASGTVSVQLDGTTFVNISVSTSGTFSNLPVNVPAGYRGGHLITGKDNINVSSGISFNIIQKINVSSTTGTTGEQITIQGEGFARESTIVVDFDGNEVKANIVSDPAGSFSYIFEIPEAPAGKHTIHVKDKAGNEDALRITVTERLIITPDSGPSGTVIEVTGTGFGPQAPVTITFDGSKITNGITTSVNGSFYTSFKVPVSLPGIHIIEASAENYIASSKFAVELAASISQNTSVNQPGYVGMTLIISGSGFTPDSMINVTQNSLEKSITTARSNSEGGFNIEFVVPPTTSGLHKLVVSDGANKREFDLFIEQEAPPTPMLFSPEANKKASTPVFFDWQDVSDNSGVQYAIQIATDGFFTDIVLEEKNLTVSELRIAKNALQSVTKEHPYYWRVKAIDKASNEGAWSEPKAFIVGFVVTLPNGEQGINLSATTVYLTCGGILVALIISFVLGKLLNRRRA